MEGWGRLKRLRVGSGLAFRALQRRRSFGQVPSSQRAMLYGCIHTQVYMGIFLAITHRVFSSGIFPVTHIWEYSDLKGPRCILSKEYLRLFRNRRCRFRTLGSLKEESRLDNRNFDRSCWLILVSKSSGIYPFTYANLVTVHSGCQPGQTSDVGRSNTVMVSPMNNPSVRYISWYLDEVRGNVFGIIYAME
ncbi:hypothetical protein GYMLUDRAFT_784127 [Collybiopsis luxurians FD-317 M1]|uniref:Uncharacterized protein n=1 Tax=Collybiopsis luxurians FD-317 M1 TaxID=944289 RepID=A0A0D0CMU8_9AGAR|nr:hypothetical protein GYMLUDRAFT_784127 [Collybiopsis luxurians FD-317 M1]